MKMLWPVRDMKFRELRARNRNFRIAVLEIPIEAMGMGKIFLKKKKERKRRKKGEEKSRT